MQYHQNEETVKLKFLIHLFFMKSLQQFFCTVMLSNFSGVAYGGISSTQNAQNIADTYKAIGGSD